MIDVGSRVRARLDGESGRVLTREFDPWSRDWFYEVEWDRTGGVARLPRNVLVEVTCAEGNPHVKIVVDKGEEAPPPRPR